MTLCGQQKLGGSADLENIHAFPSARRTNTQSLTSQLCTRLAPQSEHPSYLTALLWYKQCAFSQERPDFLLAPTWHLAWQRPADCEQLTPQARTPLFAPCTPRCFVSFSLAEETVCAPLAPICSLLRKTGLDWSKQISLTWRAGQCDQPQRETGSCAGMIAAHVGSTAHAELAKTVMFRSKSRFGGKIRVLSGLPMGKMEGYACLEVMSELSSKVHAQAVPRTRQ